MKNSYLTKLVEEVKEIITKEKESYYSDILEKEIIKKYQNREYIILDNMSFNEVDICDNISDLIDVLIMYLGNLIETIRDKIIIKFEENEIEAFELLKEDKVLEATLSYTEYNIFPKKTNF